MVADCFSNYLKTQRLSSNTIQQILRRIDSIRASHIDLFDTKAVEAYIATKDGNGYKNLLLTAYKHHFRYHSINYEFRRYARYVLKSESADMPLIISFNLEFVLSY